MRNQLVLFPQTVWEVLRMRIDYVEVTVEGDRVTLDFMQKKRSGRRRVAWATGFKSDRTALYAEIEAALKRLRPQPLVAEDVN